MLNETVTLEMGAVMPETFTVELVEPPSGTILIPKLLKLVGGPDVPLLSTSGMEKVPALLVVTDSSRSMFCPQVNKGETLSWKAVLFVPRALAATFG